MPARILPVATTLALAVNVLGASPAGAAPSGLADDFNGDGYRNLAVGTPKASGGTVTVLLGSSSGVSRTRFVNATQSTPGVPGASESVDRFGENVTSGYVNHYGYADLRNAGRTPPRPTRPSVRPIGRDLRSCQGPTGGVRWLLGGLPVCRGP